jgi:hypothetical protein
MHAFIIQSPKEKQSVLISFLLSYLGSPALMLTVLTFQLFGLTVFLLQTWSHHTTHNKGVLIIILFLL